MLRASPCMSTKQLDAIEIITEKCWWMSDTLRGAAVLMIAMSKLATAGARIYQSRRPLRAWYDHAVCGWKPALTKLHPDRHNVGCVADRARACKVAL